MRTRRATSTDLNAVLEVVADAFVEEPAVVGLVRDLADADGFETGRAFLAENDAGACIGFVLLTPAHVEDSVAPLLCLAPLAVASKAQGCGVGTGLVRAALEAATARGFSAVLVLGSPQYYGRFGFVPAYPLGLEPPRDIPEEHRDAWMVAETTAGGLAGLGGTVRLMSSLEDPQYW